MKKIALKYKLLFLIIIVQLPFFFFFMLYSNNVRDNINRQLVKGHAETLTAFCNELRNQLSNSDIYFSKELFTNPTYQSIQKSTNLNEIVFLLNSETDSFNQFMSINSYASSIAFYSTQTNTNYCFYNNLHNLTPSEKEAISKTFKNEFSNSKDGWYIVTNFEQPILIRIVENNALKCGIAINMDRITKNSQYIYNLSSPVVFMQDTNFLTSSMWVRDYKKSPQIIKDTSQYQILRVKNINYVAVSENVLNFKAVYAVPYLYDWKWQEVTLWTLISTIIFSFLIAWFYLYIYFFKPLRKLNAVMREIRNGNITARAENYGNFEFNQVNTVFNQMVDHIENLKIEAYENKISAQRSQLNALRLQIRRHFFLNCLKNVYAMAEFGEKKDIQGIVIMLSDYLRYTLDISNNLIPLRNELEMCENYVNLQYISQTSKPKLELSIDASLMNFKIPPVSILSLVENCCKYGISTDKILTIWIDINHRRIEDEEFVNITVRDNGRGFSEETLKILNSTSGIDKLFMEKHIGIGNVILRFRMIYGQDCLAIFSNNNGAKTEIIVPLKRGFLNEAVDS